MLNRTAALSIPPRKSEKVNTAGEPPAPARGKSQLREAHMDMNEAISVSEMLDQQPNKGNGSIHKLKQREDSYQAAYEAGLASGREAGYRRGYRGGFSDGYKMRTPAGGAASTPETSTGASKRAAANRAGRLRGLPCANCGCASYSDETQCPSCRTPK